MQGNKIFFTDTECTGLSTAKNELVQLSGAIANKIDDTFVIDSFFDFRFKPWKPKANISHEALNIIGYTVDDLMEFPDRMQAFEVFEKWMHDRINPYDKTDKAFPAGYNIQFDISMIDGLYKQMGNNYLGSVINWKGLDGQTLVTLFLMASNEFSKALPNTKLSSVAEYYGVALDAHDALEDIKATIKIIDFLCQDLKLDIKIQIINDEITRNY